MRAASPWSSDSHKPRPPLSHFLSHCLSLRLCDLLFRLSPAYRTQAREVDPLPKRSFTTGVRPSPLSS